MKIKIRFWVPTPRVGQYFNIIEDTAILWFAILWCTIYWVLLFWRYYCTIPFVQYYCKQDTHIDIKPQTEVLMATCASFCLWVPHSNTACRVHNISNFTVHFFHSNNDNYHKGTWLVICTGHLAAVTGFAVCVHASPPSSLDNGNLPYNEKRL